MDLYLSLLPGYYTGTAHSVRWRARWHLRACLGAYFEACLIAFLEACFIACFRACLRTCLSELRLRAALERAARWEE